MDEKFKSRPFYYRLFGEYALFTDPVTKGGGEKYSYQIPTYQAIKGITEQLYWKPTLIYVIDSIKVLNRISTESKGVRTPLKNGSNDLNYYTYLKDVEYLVKFHFEWNENRPDLKDDWNEIKHEQILLRSLDKGGRRDLFLGVRECVGFIERIRESEFDHASSYYNGRRLSFGIMFHSFTYPSEGLNEMDGKLISNFTSIQMDSGRVDFIRPEECEIHHSLLTYNFKQFTPSDIRFAEEEALLLDKEVKME